MTSPQAQVQTRGGAEEGAELARQARAYLEREEILVGVQMLEAWVGSR